MTDAQHIDEITIPIIEISPGWEAASVSTLEECEDAYVYLTSAIAEIEYEVELSEIGASKFEDPTWPARARRALRYRKAAINIVNSRRAQLERKRKRKQQHYEDREFIKHVQRCLGDEKFNDLRSSFSFKEDAV